MKTIDVLPGSPNTVTVNPGTSTTQVSTNEQNLFLEDKRLPITQIGQTRWNVGGSELRTKLYLNGVKLTIGTDYVINLPYLDLTLPFNLETDDELILSI